MKWGFGAILVCCLAGNRAYAGPRFGAPSTIMIEGSHVSLSVGDLNMLPGVDMALGSESSLPAPSVSLVLNRGNGTFVPNRRIALTGGQYILHTATIGDFNGDHIGDVAVATDDASDLPLHTSIFTSNHAVEGSFGAPDLTLDGRFPRALLAADFSGDGRDDLVVADSSPTGNGEITVLRSADDPPFVADMPIAVGSAPSRLLIDDIDADGERDLVVLDPSLAVYVLYGTGNGTFAAALAVGASSSPAAVGILRSSGRARADLVVGTESGNLLTFRQLAPRQFTMQSTVPVTQPVADLATGDFDGDGAADVVLSQDGLPGVGLWYQTAATGFEFGETVAVGEVTVLVAADLNGDAKPDLALVPATGDQLVVVLNGMDAPPTPTRTRTPTPTIRPMLTPTATFTLGPPTLTPTQTQTFTITPTPSSTATITPSATVTPTPAGPGDANCDGRLDLLDLPALIGRLFEPGCAKADANVDGRVSSADMTSLVGVLATR